MTGHPADPGLDAALATLREFVGTHDDPYDGDTSGVFALRRVEAELARLREERDALQHRVDCADTPLMRDVLADKQAADARCARLQQALLGTRERTAPDGQPCWCPDWKVDDWRGYSTDDWRDPDLQVALHHECCIAAREALAGPDTPADEEPCPFCGFAGPFDGHVCEPVLCGCGDPENCRYATPEEHAGLDTPADSQEDKT